MLTDQGDQAINPILCPYCATDQCRFDQSMVALVGEATQIITRLRCTEGHTFQHLLLQGPEDAALRLTTGEDGQPVARSLVENAISRHLQRKAALSSIALPPGATKPS